MQMRFLDEDGKKPMKRSHCGNGEDFLAFQAATLKMQNKKQPDNFMAKKRKMCSKVVVLRKHLSSRNSKRTDNQSGKVRDNVPQVLVKHHASLMDESDEAEDFDRDGVE